jgi:TetR/AcrR family fatty acid metabolism transcriptional regulator
MARPRTLDSETRRARILDAALALLSQKGYHDVRLDDVARRADIAKGTLYLYFRDKESLCSAVMQDVAERLDATLKSLSPTTPVRDALAALARSETAFIARHRDFFAQIALQKSAAVSTLAGKHLKEWFDKHVGNVKTLLDRGVKDGTLRPHQTREGALAFVALCRMFALHLVSPGGEPTANDVERLLDLFLNGTGRKTPERGRS